MHYINIYLREFANNLSDKLKSEIKEMFKQKNIIRNVKSLLLSCKKSICCLCKKRKNLFIESYSDLEKGDYNNDYNYNNFEDVPLNDESLSECELDYNNKNKFDEKIAEYVIVSK